jgi:thiol-disulfide isomerase/thioredoxin
MRTRTPWIGPVLAAGLLSGLLAGCGRARTAQAPGEDAPAAPAAATPEIRPATVDEILAVVREPGAEVVLLNVWATWCGPCREEFPDLVRVHRELRDRGVRLVLVSTDAPAHLPAARDFLAKHGVDVTSFLKQGSDTKFIEALSPEWSGALPATLIYDGQGRRIWFHEGKTTYDVLEREISKALGSDTSHPKET